MTHQHFMGAAHTFEIITKNDKKRGEYVRPDVTILKTFFINSKVNQNNWQVEWEGIKKDAEELPGTPLVLQEDLEHPSFSKQSLYDRGTIFDYDTDDEKEEVIAYVRITDPKIIERIRSGELQYVSPAVIPRSDGDLSKINGVDIMKRTLPLHLAIVSDPAYGTDQAKMSHMCTGDGEACLYKLKMMTAKIAYNAKSYPWATCISDQLKDGHSEQSADKICGYIKAKYGMAQEETKKADVIDALTQTPLIKKNLASLSRIGSIFEKIKIGSKFHMHNGKEGYWINAKNINVFIARNQPIQEAVDSQCGCPLALKTATTNDDGEKGTWITSNGQHIFIKDGEDKGEVVKEHFDKLEKSEKKTDSESKKKTEKVLDSMENNKIRFIYTDEGVGLGGNTYEFYQDNKKWVNDNFSWDFKNKEWTQKFGSDEEVNKVKNKLKERFEEAEKQAANSPAKDILGSDYGMVNRLGSSEIKKYRWDKNTTNDEMFNEVASKVYGNMRWGAGHNETITKTKIKESLIENNPDVKSPYKNNNVKLQTGHNQVNSWDEEEASDRGISVEQLHREQTRDTIREMQSEMFSQDLG